MAHTVTTFPVVSARPALSLRRIWSLAYAMYEARATRRLLADLDQRMLADIGTSPADAHMEANRPFWDLERSRRG